MGELPVTDRLVSLRIHTLRSSTLRRVDRCECFLVRERVESYKTALHGFLWEELFGTMIPGLNIAELVHKTNRSAATTSSSDSRYLLFHSLIRTPDWIMCDESVLEVKRVIAKCKVFGRFS